VDDAHGDFGGAADCPAYMPGCPDALLEMLKKANITILQILMRQDPYVYNLAQSCCREKELRVNELASWS
jgi:hypothetical protein